MIKRYGLGANPDAFTPNSMRPSLVQIVEREDGGYVLYDDHLSVLESIGAGGVSGRITEKPLEQHRLEFERWAEPQQLSIATSMINDDFYANGDTQYSWQAWLASKGINK